jgi:hypothetical protein
MPEFGPYFLLIAGNTKISKLPLIGTVRAVIPATHQVGQEDCNLRPARAKH